MTTEKTTIGITGNETIKELVKKVNKCDSLEDKMGVCLMIIPFIEIRNGVPPGFFTWEIGYSKKYPPYHPNDEGQILLNERLNCSYKKEINDFLFHLKNSDYECFSTLVDMYNKLSKKEERKEKLISFSVIVGFILLLILIINYLYY
jgi:hypothetical protein